MSKGFTLLETLIYILFFTLLIGVLLGITFQVIASTDQVNKKSIVQQEANFVLRKLNWVLSGADSVTSPSLADGSGSVLTVVNSGAGVTAATFDLNAGVIRLELPPNPPMPLTTSNITVANLNFTHSQIVGQPEKITASFQIGAEQFSLTKYLYD